MDDKETLTAEIGHLQPKYTVAVKAYGIIKNTAEREKAKALIARLLQTFKEILIPVA